MLKLKRELAKVKKNKINEQEVIIPNNVNLSNSTITIPNGYKFVNFSYYVDGRRINTGVNDENKFWGLVWKRSRGEADYRYYEEYLVELENSNSTDTKLSLREYINKYAPEIYNEAKQKLEDTSTLSSSRFCRNRIYLDEHSFELIISFYR